MNKSPGSEDVCPLAAVDQRLADTHRLWHQAEAAYFDPDGFRLAIQNTIQTLRTVTFILQKHKAIIPNFAEWYGDIDKKIPGEWQRRLGTDPLMRWMVDARNRIEKQGDLEANSMVSAEVIASYLDEGPRVEVPAHLFDTVGTLIEQIPNTALGEHVRRNGMLRVQRRWIENTLPDYELLDAVAIAFGKIAELVHDAHRQIGLDPPKTIHDEDHNSYDLPSMGWRFPCMIAHELPRTLLISLADGSVIEFETKHVPLKVNTEQVTALVERYGGTAFEAMGHNYESNVELAAGYFSLARSVFQRDGHHITLLFLFRERKLVRMPIQVVFGNVQQKYALMRQLAAEATTSGADAAILIGEAWMAPADKLRPYERPADVSFRTEVLTLHLVGKDGTSVACEADIIRNGTNVSLGETRVTDGSAAFGFVPFLQSWGVPIPASWMETSSMIITAAKRD